MINKACNCILQVIYDKKREREREIERERENSVKTCLEAHDQTHQHRSFLSYGVGQCTKHTVRIVL